MYMHILRSVLVYLYERTNVPLSSAWLLTFFLHPPFLADFFFPINFHIFFVFLFYFFPIFPLSAQLTSKAGWLTLFWAIGSLCLWFNYFCLVWNWTHLAKKKFSQSKTRCPKVFSTKSISFPLSWKIGRHSGLNIIICKKKSTIPEGYKPVLF